MSKTLSTKPSDLLKGTVLMALLQPAPEVYDLFDDILLLCEGGHLHCDGC